MLEEQAPGPRSRALLSNAKARRTLRLDAATLPQGWLPPTVSPLRVLLDARGRVEGPCALLDTTDADDWPLSLSESL